MKRSVVILSAIIVLIATATQARNVVHHLRSVDYSNTYSESYGGNSIISAMESQLGTNPTGWSHAWCAHFLGQTLKRLGFRTSGSDEAISYIHYGHPTGPVPGAIAVMPHHVMVVMKVLGNGRVQTISGNHGHKVGIGVYPMNRIIAYRAP